jgi:hypothetical protein
MKNTMKFQDIIPRQSRRPLKIIISEQQFQRLSSSVVALMEQEKITKTYLINKKPNGK